MSAIVIVGAQWGDEGKGKITDLLAGEVDIVARYGGGDNAGHTVVIEGATFRHHLIPSGIHHSQVTCLLGNGMVINPQGLLEEMKELAARGVDVSPGRLKISGSAHLIMPYHIALDGAAEEARGKEVIGTTMRGIGPAYADKAARTGLRVADMLEHEFKEKVQRAVRAKNKMLEKIHGLPPLNPQQVAEEYVGYAQQLTPYVFDTSLFLEGALRIGKKVLCEGAQGTLLDLDHGTYPYVTSSSSAAGGALPGLGFGPRWIERVIGVAKAYTTRVGSGPLPTELTDEMGDHLVEAGREYGTTTGRRRRCGWLDIVILRYAARINGLTELAVTKLDVLSGLDPLWICVAYRYGDQRLEDFPLSANIQAQCEPIYEELPGWEADITRARSGADLPPAALGYLKRVEELVGLPITLISVGLEREQTIITPSEAFP